MNSLVEFYLQDGAHAVLGTALLWSACTVFVWLVVKLLGDGSGRPHFSEEFAEVFHRYSKLQERLNNHNAVAFDPREAAPEVPRWLSFMVPVNRMLAPVTVPLTVLMRDHSPDYIADAGELHDLREELKACDEELTALTKANKVRTAA